MRDVFKAWYVAGINSKVDSIDSLCALISELTKGYKLITVGSSAGGYIATIVGIRLNALRIYNFSGQWFLKDVCKSPLLSYFANDVKHSQFYDMEWVDFESMSILPPIVYFFPKGNADDIEQEKYMRSKKCDNIIYFPIRSKEHGIAVYRENLPYLITMEIEDLLKISNGKISEVSDGSISPERFLLLTAGRNVFLKAICTKKLRKIKNHILKR